MRAALARLAHVQSHSDVAATDKRILDAVNRLLEVRCPPRPGARWFRICAAADVLVRAGTMYALCRVMAMRKQALRLVTVLRGRHYKVEATASRMNVQDHQWPSGVVFHC